MVTNHSAQLVELADRLGSAEKEVRHTNVVMGFDAFVDESIRIVGERNSPESFQAMSTISDFGAWASAAAGRSGSREFICEQITAGGCTVNMGDGMAAAGFPLAAFSGVGSPSHPVFESFVSKCRSVHPLGMEPGRAIVTEFDDGKLMFCAFSHFANFTPEYLREQFADGKFVAACQQAKGIAFTSWSVYPYMTDCWRFICDEALDELSHRPHFFFDLADPASRTAADLVGMVDALSGFEKLGPVTLSLNGNEANQVARALELQEAGNDAESLEHLAKEIRTRAAISEASIHLVKRATTVTAERATTVEGPYCEQPKRSVGAGDRFNAGLFAGQLLGLEPAQQLQLGCASSGYFVRNAQSATWPQLVQFIRQWADGNILGDSF